MHISEGVLNGPILAIGAGCALTGLFIGLKNMDEAHLVKAGVLSAAFFVASMIHIPLGPSQIHLVLNGLIGLLLGWAAFPAIFVALTLQFVMFQYGGLLTLGVNTCIIATPGIFCHYLFLPLIKKKQPLPMIAAFFSGFSAVLLSTAFLGLTLVAAEESFQMLSGLIFLSNLPLMIIEGMVTVFIIGFLKKVVPELLFSSPFIALSSPSALKSKVVSNEKA